MNSRHSKLDVYYNMSVVVVSCKLVVINCALFKCSRYASIIEDGNSTILYLVKGVGWRVCTCVCVSVTKAEQGNAIGNSIFYERSRSLSNLNLSSIGKPRTQTLTCALERKLGITESDEDNDNDIQIQLLRATGLRAADPGGTIPLLLLLLP